MGFLKGLFRWTGIIIGNVLMALVVAVLYFFYLTFTGSRAFALVLLQIATRQYERSEIDHQAIADAAEAFDRAARDQVRQAWDATGVNGFKRTA